MRHCPRFQYDIKEMPLRGHFIYLVISISPSPTLNIKFNVSIQPRWFEILSHLHLVHFPIKFLLRRHV